MSGAVSRSAGALMSARQRTEVSSQAEVSAMGNREGAHILRYPRQLYAQLLTSRMDETCFARPAEARPRHAQTNPDS